MRRLDFTATGSPFAELITPGDFNSDGRTALLVTSGDLRALLLQQADDSFVEESLGAADDLLLCRGNAVEIWLRSAAGGWQSLHVFDMPDGCDGLQLLDWNGDGLPDIVARGQVLLGRARRRPCPRRALCALSGSAGPPRRRPFTPPTWRLAPERWGEGRLRRDDV